MPADSRSDKLPPISGDGKGRSPLLSPKAERFIPVSRYGLRAKLGADGYLQALPPEEARELLDRRWDRLLDIDSLDANVQAQANA
jgi:hypothetical protein